MGKLACIAADRGSARRYEGGKGRVLSSRIEGLGVIAACLAEEGGAEADPTHAVAYDGLRALVGEEFVRRFGMDREGAKKTAGDRIGGHGLLARDVLPDGREVVFVALAARRAQRALAALRGCTGREQRAAWEALRREWKADRAAASGKEEDAP